MTTPLKQKRLEWAPPPEDAAASAEQHGANLGHLAADEKLLAPFLAEEFGLTADQGQQLARRLLQSAMTIEESATINVRSVSFFHIFNTALQEFGD